MRVVAGSARGLRLDAPPGRAVRPTADRVREAMFSSLSALVPDAAVLDLFAGSGALAIEALSRGAASAVLVERDRRAAAVAAANLARTGLDAHAELVHGDAGHFVGNPRGGPFRIVFLDPPYDHPLSALYTMVEGLQSRGALTRDVTVVVERDRRDPALDAEPPDFLAVHRRRTYGDTVLVYLDAAGREGTGG